MKKKCITANSTSYKMNPTAQVANNAFNKHAPVLQVFETTKESLCYLHLIPNNNTIVLIVQVV
jgi:hypothetical protein